MKNQLIIFSKNRACQLDLLISSIEINNEFNLFDKTTVIYKADNDEYKKGYEILKSDWGFINFVEETDFKTDLLNVIDKTYEFTTFMVDDMVMFDKINVDKKEILKTITNDVVCFSLRLGKNCIYSHPANLNYKMSKFNQLNNDMIKFNWREQQAGDLSYPLSTDGHIYATWAIRELLITTSFNNPNTLEANLQLYSSSLTENPYIVCFNQSKTVSVPVNLVNTTFNNRHGLKHGISAKELNDKYLNDKIIDYHSLDFTGINGPHKELEYKFTKIDD